MSCRGARRTHSTGRWERASTVTVRPRGEKTWAAAVHQKTWRATASASRADSPHYNSCRDSVVLGALFEALHQIVYQLGEYVSRVESKGCSHGLSSFRGGQRISSEEHPSSEKVREGPGQRIHPERFTKCTHRSQLRCHAASHLRTFDHDQPVR